MKTINNEVKLLIKVLGFVFLLSNVISCSAHENSTAGIKQLNENKPYSAPAAEDSELFCYSNKVDKKLMSCQLAQKKLKKLLKEIPFWSSQSGGWSPVLLKSKSIIQRHQLGESDVTCLIRQFCQKMEH